MTLERTKAPGQAWGTTIESAGSLPDPTGQPDGDVLTIVSGSPAWAPSGGSQPLRFVTFPFSFDTTGLELPTTVVSLGADEIVAWVFGRKGTDSWDGSSPRLLFAPIDVYLPTGAFQEFNMPNFGVQALDPLPTVTGPKDIIARLFSNQADAITVVNQGTKTFTVAGDVAVRYPATAPIALGASTGNDGEYTVVSATFDTDHTDIVVAEAIPDPTVDGIINFGGLFDTTQGDSELIIAVAALA